MVAPLGVNVFLLFTFFFFSKFTIFSFFLNTIKTVKILYSNSSKTESNVIGSIYFFFSKFFFYFFLFEIGNAAPVQLRENGRILVPFCRNNKEIWLTYSYDDVIKKINNNFFKLNFVEFF